MDESPRPYSWRNTDGMPSKIDPVATEATPSGLYSSARKWKRLSGLNGFVRLKMAAFFSLIPTQSRSDGSGNLSGHASSGVYASTQQKAMMPMRALVAQTASRSAGGSGADNFRLNKAAPRDK